MEEVKTYGEESEEEDVQKQGQKEEIPDGGDAVREEETQEQVVECETLEVAGEISDGLGNTWQIPADGLDDPYDLGSVNPFEHLRLDPRFHYQLVRNDKVSVKRLEQFVPVTKDEVGLMSELDVEYGTPQSTVVTYLDSTLMKIPKVLAKRRRDARTREAQRVVEDTEPTAQMQARDARDGRPPIRSTREMHSRMQREGTPLKVERTSEVKSTIAS